MAFYGQADGWSDLSEIIGPAPDQYDADRIVAFGIEDDLFCLTEQCDDYFTVRLEVPQLDRLIAFLSARRAELAGVELASIQAAAVEWFDCRQSKLDDMLSPRMSADELEALERRAMSAVKALEDAVRAHKVASR